MTHTRAHTYIMANFQTENEIDNDNKIDNENENENEITCPRTW